MAIVSLLTSEGLRPLADPDTEQEDFRRLATVLALQTGLIMTVMSFLHAGVVVNFLSEPVVTGFMSAAGPAPDALSLSVQWVLTAFRQLSSSDPRS